MMKRKTGNVEIIFLMFIITVLIIFSFVIYVLYVQITTYIIPIKQDVFYIVQNSYLALNQNNLEYDDYVINSNELEHKVNVILKKNHPEAKVITILYDYNKNKVYIEIVINIKPIVLGDYIGNMNIKIKDEIKLKMMEVK